MTGAALLLLPGFMMDDDLWADVTPELQRWGPVAHADLGRDDSIPAMARRTLEQAPEAFLAIGFSMGGYVAREIARMAPGRIRGLVLVATSARPDGPGQARRKVAAAEGAGRFAGLSRGAVLSALHPERTHDQALIRRVQAMAVRRGPMAFRRQSLLDRPGDADRLGDIRCPTLILAGADDRLRSAAEAEELHRGIAGSELGVVEGAGHLIPLEAPEAFVAAVARWLEKALRTDPEDGGG